MNISIDKNQYMVPVRFVGIEELGIIDLQGEDFYIRSTEECVIAQGINLRRYYENFREAPESTEDDVKAVSPEQLEMIKDNIKKQIEYKFLKMRDFAKFLTAEQILDMHINQYKDILVGHVNNIPCFSVIKDKSINGMNLDQVLESHINKFKETYNFHKNAFNCEEMNMIKTPKISQPILDMKTKEMAMETEAMFKNMVKVAENLSLEQVLQVYELICTTIIQAHIDNVPCFNTAVSKNMNGMSLPEIINMHITKLKNTFNNHVELLECNK
ncbi:hypothetical protein [Clostridium sp.]|uniref:hypothetical protein n=1 Tax=Clostridium sp. TaxID=1506 RepID=UPI003216700E